MSEATSAGATPATIRYRFSYTSFNRGLFTLLGIGPERSSVEVDREVVRVRMGWSFQAEIPRSAIRSITREKKPFGFGAGVHGWRGRWVVNGSNNGVVRLVLDPPPAARMLSIVTIKPRELFLSLENPTGFIASLGRV
jgi:hypothetical protein